MGYITDALFDITGKMRFVVYFIINFNEILLKKFDQWLYNLCFVVCYSVIRRRIKLLIFCSKLYYYFNFDRVFFTKSRHFVTYLKLL